MVERSGRSKGRSKDRRRPSVGHNRAWIWGRHAVLQTLQAGRWPITELHLAQTLSPSDIQTATAYAEPWQSRVEVVGPERLTALCKSGEHQGYLARLGAYPYVDERELLSSLGPRALLLVLDRVQDPFNYGALLRSAEVFAVDAVLVAAREQAEINAQVVRSSAGAVNHLRIACCDDLVAAAERLSEHGVDLVAATERGSMPFSDSHITGSTAVILGSEGFGIRPELLERCDRHVTIPQFGQTPALNVAVAGGILLCEFRRQLPIQTSSSS